MRPSTTVSASQTPLRVESGTTGSTAGRGTRRERPSDGAAADCAWSRSRIVAWTSDEYVRRPEGRERGALIGADRARAGEEPAGDAHLLVEERVQVVEAAALAELLAVIGDEEDRRIVPARERAEAA